MSILSVQLLSRSLTLCDPMDCSMPGLLVHHQLPEFTHGLMSMELVMPSKHVILCHPLLLPPSVFPSISISSNESVLHHRWSVYWSFNFNISPSDEQPGLIFRMDSLHPSSSISLQSKGLSTVFSNTIVQKHQFCCTQVSL